MDYIVLGLFVVFCLVFGFAKPYLIPLLTECFRPELGTAEDELLRTKLSRLGLLFFLAGVAAYALAARLHLGPNKSADFGIFLGIFLLGGGLKAILLKGIGRVIDSPQFANSLSRAGLNYTLLTGMVFFLFFCLMSLVAPKADAALLLGSSIICALGYLLYLARSLKIFISSYFSLFFWILYLCTLELVPYGLLIHYVVQIQ